jgi:hypothetical protein
MEYINCLDREYDSKNKCYSFIEFAIGRYGKKWKTLEFTNLVTEKDAIKAAEDYLNQPIDDDHFNIIKNDVFPKSVRDDFETRYDVLGDCRFLENVKNENRDNKFGIMIECGS